VDGSYAQRCATLSDTLRQAPAASPAGLHKEVSNLFRHRGKPPPQRLDVSQFNHVLRVDRDGGWMDVEGMTSYEQAVSAALAEGVMPAVVPELKTITVGGAAAGVGIESSSFKYGLMHETILEADVLLADGRVVLASPANEHADLFYALPNSYGTLGYALRLRVATQPVRPCVRIERETYRDPEAFFGRLTQACESDADFVDGVVFAEDELVLNVARFVDHAPRLSDYTYEQIYYRSIRSRPEDYLSAHDYIWRWDTDWFWCSKNVLAQNPLVRRIYGRARLGSRTYTRIMRWNARVGLTKALDALRSGSSEALVQDVDIPIERAAEFLAFFHARVGIRPVWICPIRPQRSASRFTLFPMRPGALYVNFGFWDTVRSSERLEPGHLNRLVEREVARLGGIKSLYSDSYYSEGEFWATYDRDAYFALKRTYDPHGRFGDLYAKCVLKR
jgi:FAD/FMN-containing dehydrogenase